MGATATCRVRIQRLRVQCDSWGIRVLALPVSPPVTFSRWLIVAMAGKPVDAVNRRLRVVARVGCLAIGCGGAQHENRYDGGERKSGKAFAHCRIGSTRHGRTHRA